MREMTPRERLLAALRREPVDRIPVSPRIWAYRLWRGLDDLPCARMFGYDPYTEGGGVATPLVVPFCEGMAFTHDVQVEIERRRDGPKTIARRTFRTPGGSLRDVIVLPDPGREYGIAPNMEWLEPLVKSREDARLLACILPGPERQDLGALRALEGRWGEEGLVLCRVSAGVDQVAIDAMGIANAMLHLHDDPALFDEVFRVADEWHTSLLEHALEGGARLFFESFFNMSLSAGWSPATWRGKVLPIVRRHTDLIHAHGGLVVFYDDGKIMGIADRIGESGVDALQTVAPPPVGDADFAALRRMLGGRTCFWGGVDLGVILRGTPRQVEAQVREVVEALGPTGLIVGTSDSIRDGSPEENVRALVEATRR